MANAELHGLLVLDKPGGVTSRTAVDRAQRWFPRGTRLGHTGTLDPLATGVLVLCVGAATRLAEYVQRMPKVYRAGITLGGRSDTDDADGTVTPTPGATPPCLEQVQGPLQTFLGEIEQVPPAYSAAKVAGRRSYALARRGEETNLAARTVTIYAIDLLRYDYPHLDLEVRCGKGTYIRSLARDLGERLGVGGYVASLRRTRVGPFDVARAVPPDVDAATARQAMLPTRLAVAELPARTVTDDEARRLRQGQALPLAEDVGDAAEVALYDPRGALAAVGTVDSSRRIVKPGKVLHRAEP